MYVEDDGVKEEQQLKPTRDPKIGLFSKKT